MDKQQIENSLIILKLHEEISNITYEFRNTIPEKHINQFEVLLIELDLIASSLSALESSLYLQYLDNQTKDPIIKPYEIEDFYMIENVFNNEPDQLSKNDITYLFKLLNKFIKE